MEVSHHIQSNLRLKVSSSIMLSSCSHSFFVHFSLMRKSLFSTSHQFRTQSTQSSFSLLCAILHKKKFSILLNFCFCWMSDFQLWKFSLALEAHYCCCCGQLYGLEWFSGVLLRFRKSGRETTDSEWSGTRVTFYERCQIIGSSEYFWLVCTMIDLIILHVMMMMMPNESEFQLRQHQKL